MFNHHRIARGFLILILLALCLGVAAGTTAMVKGDVDAQMWSSRIWKTALNSNKATIDTLRVQFDAIPTDSFTKDYLAYFRRNDQQNRINEEKSLLQRDEDRVEALGEMREHIANQQLDQALVSAVKVQTLSDNYNTAFENDDIREIIAWAERDLSEIEAEQDWLRAQEIIFRMRTLFEDTERRADYERYNKRLTVVNRRVSLLAHYAPRRMHEFRKHRAERLGEKPLPDFNPVKADDWKDRLAGISAKTLRNSLHRAATEHIEAGGKDNRNGWRPLLIGGLEALRTFATTPSLSESFPDLADQEKVNRWVAFLNVELAKVERLQSRKLTRSGFRRMLDRLVAANSKAIDLPRELLYREFGDGAMYKLDRFSEIMWPDKLRRFEQSTQGNFVGVGIIIRHTETNDIMVVNPLEGTPAYYGGVKPNDLIVEVDGESTVGWSLNDTVDHITGAPNTDVTLGLKRENHEKLLPITLTRKLIKLRSVKGWWKERLSENGDPVWDWLLDSKTRIAYIKLTQFTGDTYVDLLVAWNEIQQAGGANGLILDLRYNPGGLLISAVQISNLFIESGVIVSGEDKDGREAWPAQRATQQRAMLAGLPTVVLINKGSASASEIVAGCLQAHGAAVIVGERSYGKGSVQTVHSIARNTQLKLTTQYYRLPPNHRLGEVKGRLVHKRPGATEWGVDPDILVTMTPSQIEESYFLRQKADIIPENEAGVPEPESTERPDISEMLTKGIDPQLESALLLLQARVLGDIDSATRHASIK